MIWKNQPDNKHTWAFYYYCKKQGDLVETTKNKDGSIDMRVLSADQDGISHINVYSKGKTELGRMLSNFYKAPIYLPEHGSFNSIEGYWYWLTRRDDALRSLWGFRAKQIGRSLPKIKSPDNFVDCIKSALFAKLTQHPYIYHKLINNTLPLQHYYVYSGKVVEPKKHKWIIDYLSKY